MGIAFLLFEFELDLRLFIFELLLKLREPLVDVFHLLELEAVQLLLHLVHQLLILVIQPVSVHQHLLEVKYILFETVTHLLDLDEFVPVVLVEHALDANCHTALLAEVLYRLVRVAGAKHECLTTIGSGGKEEHFWGHEVLAPLQDNLDLLVLNEFARIGRLY